MIRGNRLLDMRRERGLSQAALGQRVGLDGPYIHKLEHGQLRGITTTTLLRLVQVLQVSADYLLGLSEVMQVTSPATLSGAPPRPQPMPLVVETPPAPPQSPRPSRPQMCPHCAVPLQPLPGLEGLSCSACRYRRVEG
jgi:transcriptional regulator with XRE-family HTH domain